MKHFWLWFWTVVTAIFGALNLAFALTTGHWYSWIAAVWCIGCASYDYVVIRRMQ